LQLLNFKVTRDKNYNTSIAANNNYPNLPILFITGHLPKPSEIWILKIRIDRVHI